MKSPELLVSLDISKVSLRLDGADLTIKNTFLTLGLAQCFVTVGSCLCTFF